MSEVVGGEGPVGSRPADIAVLRVVKGEFGFVDSARLRMKGDTKLVAEMTIRDGRVVWDLNGTYALASFSGQGVIEEFYSTCRHIVMSIRAEKGSGAEK